MPYVNNNNEKTSNILELSYRIKEKLPISALSMLICIGSKTTGNIKWTDRRNCIKEPLHMRLLWWEEKTNSQCKDNL